MMLQGIQAYFGPGADDPNEILRQGALKNMTDLQFLATETLKWLGCPKRSMQMKGRAYYRYAHEFEDTVFTVRDADGMPVQYKKNIKHVIDNQYANMVDQKTNYMLGKPFSLQTQDEDYTALLEAVFDKAFKRMLNVVAVDALNGGLAWIHPYYDENGQLQFKHFPGHQILPFWADDDHTQLDLAIRYYKTIAYEGLVETTVQHVDVYRKDGIYRYVLNGGRLIPDSDIPTIAYASIADADGGTVPVGWDRIPLVAFKYNPYEIPLIQRVLPLQDAINATRSNWNNAMNEDIRDTIFVLRNYDGEDVPEFRRKLMEYGAVKVSDDGGVDTLRLERDSNQYTEYLDKTKKSLIENARGFDAKDDRMSNNPNEMNLRSMYSDIDLDTDMMETQFQAAFDQLLWFVDQYLLNSGKPDYTQEKVIFTFNRNMIVNDADTINNIRNSEGLVSNETLLAHHPYVKDVAAEMEKVAAERQESMPGMTEDYLNSGNAGGDA